MPAWSEYSASKFALCGLTEALRGELARFDIDILLIVPASLRKQWSQELFDKFSLPSSILESRSYNEAKRKGGIALLPGRADRDHLLRVCGCQG